MYLQKCPSTPAPLFKMFASIKRIQGLMSNETPQHPHPLFPVYTCVVLQAKAHTVHVFVWSSKGQLLCRKDVS